MVKVVSDMIGSLLSKQKGEDTLRPSQVGRITLDTSQRTS